MLTKRIVYLVLLWVIAAEFFNLWFYGYLDQNIKLLVLFLYSFLGAFFFRRHRWVDFRDDLIQLKLLIAGLFFSMLMASQFYNQNLLTSLVTYRFQYACLCFIPLLIISPTKQELSASFKVYAIIYSIFYLILRSNLELLAVTEEQMIKVLNHLENNEFVVNGRTLMLIGCIFYLEDLVKKFSWKTLVIITFFYIILILNQNRGHLLSMIPLLAWCIYKTQYVYRGVLWIILIPILVAFIIQSSDLWTSLFEETTSQLENDDYARNRAYSYFLFEASPNVWCYIFGNGLISYYTSDYIQELQSMHIYNSDVGIVGYWNQYGVLALLGYFYMIYHLVRNKNVPLWAKLLSFVIILNPFTGGYIAKTEALFFYFIVYYAYVYYIKHGQYEYETE